ncbi:MAG: GNA1162 family protein [bacterium]
MLKKIFVFVLLCVFLTGCITSLRLTRKESKNNHIFEDFGIKYKPDYIVSSFLYKNPPKIVAILPFKNTTREISKDGSIQIKNNNLPKDIADLLRDTFFRHISTKSYAYMKLKKSDALLKEQGLIDPDKLFEKSTQEIGKTLPADALIYGKVTHYRKFYGVIYSQVGIGVSVKMVDSHTGNLLWQASGISTSHEGRLYLSPQDLVMGSLKAALHMRKTWIYRVSDQLFRDISITLPDVGTPLIPTVIINNKTASIYSEPSRNAEIIASALRKTKFSMISRLDDWYFIEITEDKESQTPRFGWIHKEDVVSHFIKIETAKKLQRLSKKQAALYPKEHINTEKHPARYYMVKKGDTLHSIAGNPDIYGDRAKWKLIYDANKERVPQIKLLNPGQILIIPH